MARLIDELIAEDVSRYGRSPSEAARVVISNLCMNSFLRVEAIEDTAVVKGGLSKLRNLFRKPHAIDYSGLEGELSDLVAQLRSAEEYVKARLDAGEYAAAAEARHLYKRVVSVGNCCEAMRAYCKSRSTVRNPEYETNALDFYQKHRGAVYSLMLHDAGIQ